MKLAPFSRLQCVALVTGHRYSPPNAPTDTRPSTHRRMLRDHAGMRWSDQPGYKVEVPRHFPETLADQMAEPEKWLHMLREHSVDVQGPLDQYAIVPV